MNEFSTYEETPMYLVGNIAKEFSDFSIIKDRESTRGIEKFIHVMNHDYFGSSLSSYRKDKSADIDTEDYTIFCVEFGNFSAELKEEFKSDAENFRRKGWCRKLSSITSNLMNWVHSENDFEKVSNICNYILKESRTRWGEDVVMSTIEPRVYWKNNAKKECYTLFRVVFAFRNHNLPSKGCAPEKCSECPYFSMSGVETSHEWIEFYPYCSKLHKGLGEFGEKVEGRSELCPLV